jgi:hypothetical protein
MNDAQPATAAAPLLLPLLLAPRVTLLPPLLLQVSKLTTVLLRACRTAAGSSSWDPLVAGVAVGKLVQLEELDPLVLSGGSRGFCVWLLGCVGCWLGAGVCGVAVWLLGWVGLLVSGAVTCWHLRERCVAA